MGVLLWTGHGLVWTDIITHSLTQVPDEGPISMACVILQSHATLDEELEARAPREIVPR